MDQTKKPRVMTAKKFATSKLSSKTTVEGYITAHRSFLQKYSVVAYILQAYDNKDLLPTVALQTMQSALMAYYLDSQIKAAEAKMAKGQPRRRSIQCSISSYLVLQGDG